MSALITHPERGQTRPSPMLLLSRTCLSTGLKAGSGFEGSTLGRRIMMKVEGQPAAAAPGESVPLRAQKD